jgi:hypothetical protein
VPPAAGESSSLLDVLRRHGVRFVLVGGVAAVVEGAPLDTLDTDVVHERSPSNVRRLLGALEELDARYRTRPELNRTPLAEDLMGPGHHLLTTTLGPLDVLGVIGRDRAFEALAKTAHRRKLGDFYVLVLDLETQIAVKKELGFPKDRSALPLLEETLRLRKAGARRRRPTSSPSPRSRP